MSVFRICAVADPTGFDPHLTINWWTMISLSFTHSRLLKHKAGPSVQPGTFPVEGDLAESWSQPNDTTYVFKLKKGVRWHGKPPVNGMVARRLDLDVARRRKPGLQTSEYVWMITRVTAMKLDQEPFKDVRIRRALAIASNWKEILEGLGLFDGTEWAIPIDQLPPDGRRLYEHNAAEARRLLAEAGYANGFKTTVETTPGFGADFMDSVQVTLGGWKKAGVEADLKLKEMGAGRSSPTRTSPRSTFPVSSSTRRA